MSMMNKPRTKKKVLVPQGIKQSLQAQHRGGAEEGNIEYVGYLDYEETPTGEVYLEALHSDRGRENMGKVKRPDKEVHYHTHPQATNALPSAPDLRVFAQTNAQVQIIVAKNDFLIMEKAFDKPMDLSKLFTDVYTKDNIVYLDDCLQMGNCQLADELLAKLNLKVYRVRRKQPLAINITPI